MKFHEDLSVHCGGTDSLWDPRGMGIGEISVHGEKSCPDAVYCFDADAISSYDVAPISSTAKNRGS